MSFYKEVPGRKTTLESTLKFDLEPTVGSTNPVTSDGVNGAIGKSAENSLDDHDPDDLMIFDVSKEFYDDHELGYYYAIGGKIYLCTRHAREGEEGAYTYRTELTKQNGVVPVLNQLVSAVNKQWTHRAVSLTIAPGQRQQFDVQDHEFVNLTIQRNGSGNNSYVELHLHGDCYLRLEKNYRVSVLAYVGDSTTEAINVNTGRPKFNPQTSGVLAPESCSIPDQYDSSEFQLINVLNNSSEIVIETPVPSDISPDIMLLHFIGGMLIVTPLP